MVQPQDLNLCLPSIQEGRATLHQHCMEPHTRVELEGTLYKSVVWPSDTIRLGMSDRTRTCKASFGDTRFTISLHSYGAIRENRTLVYRNTNAVQYHYAMMACALAIFLRKLMKDEGKLHGTNDRNRTCTKSV